MPLSVNSEPIPESAIELEIERMRPLYRVEFADRPVDHQNRQMRTWAEENLIDHVVLLQEARRRSVDLEELVRSLHREVARPSAEDALVEYREDTERFQIPEMLRASQIVVFTNASRTPAEARRIVEHVLKELHRGANFEDLVAQYSDDPENDGDLGWFGRGQVDADVERAAFALAAGQTSGIVRSAHGYHVIRLHQRKPGRCLAYEEVKEDVMERLYIRKQEKAVESFIDQLREQADIRNA